MYVTYFEDYLSFGEDCPVALDVLYIYIYILGLLVRLIGLLGLFEKCDRRVINDEWYHRGFNSDGLSKLRAAGYQGY